VGVLNHGTMTINFSQVAYNWGPSDLQGNTGMGGGIANLNLGPANGATNSGVLTLNFSVVNDNLVSGIGGGILEAGVNLNDGTLTQLGGALTLAYSDVVDNYSASGGGIYAIAGSPVTLEEFASIENNTPDNCFPHASILGCVG